jgi:cytoskeleton protein RodZ
MNETRIDTAQSPNPVVGQSLTLGQRLRSARKGKALSLDQAAHFLHLEQPVLAALEEERYTEVGAPVFVRGHLRNYARLLELPEEIVLDAYRQADPRAEAPQKIARDLEEPLRSPPGPWAVAVAVVLLLLVAVITYVSRDTAVPAPASAVTPLGVTGEMAPPVVIEVTPDAVAGPPDEGSVSPTAATGASDTVVTSPEPLSAAPATSPPSAGDAPGAPATATATGSALNDVPGAAPAAGGNASSPDAVTE